MALNALTPKPIRQHDHRARAGQRQHFAEFQTAVSVVDALRGRQNVWTTYAQLWVAVDVQPSGGSEQTAAVLYIVTAPYDSRIRVQQRVAITLRDGSTLRLKVLTLVNPELRNVELQLQCAEATDDE